jgi:hypothetical protein
MRGWTDCFYRGAQAHLCKTDTKRCVLAIINRIDQLLKPLMQSNDSDDDDDDIVPTPPRRPKGKGRAHPPIIVSPILTFSLPPPYLTGLQEEEEEEEEEDNAGLSDNHGEKSEEIVEPVGIFLLTRSRN